jgi:thymidylate synthase (FAD)
MIDVTYINHMGSDLSVVNAARVSFGKQSEWLPRIHAGEEKQLPMKDLKLIKYLAKHKHYSPFGHCFASFHVRCPIYVHAQLEKHQYLRVNTISRRYVDTPPTFYLPDPFRYKAEDKKQGSTGNANEAVMHDGFDHALADHMEQSKKLYLEMIDRGIAPELARGWLPQAAFTEFYWSGSLDAFSAMCALRCKPDTQEESRTVADLIDDQMMTLFPVSWEALRMYEDG